MPNDVQMTTFSKTVTIYKHSFSHHENSCPKGIPVLQKKAFRQKWGKGRQETIDACEQVFLTVPLPSALAFCVLSFFSNACWSRSMFIFLLGKQLSYMEHILPFFFPINYLLT